MNRPSQQFKATQTFDWESEPHDERPSEFAQSTGYSVLSGFYVAPVASTRRRRGGLGPALVAGAVVLVMAVAAMVGLVHMLRA